MGAALAVGAATALAGGPTFTWGGANGNWNVPANWVGGVVPPSGANILVDNGNPNASIVNVNVLATVGDLTVDANDRVRITNGNRFNAVGTIVNHGVIRVDSTGGSTYFQPINGLMTLTGGGTIELSDQPTNWIYKVSAGGSLINVDNTIIGAGNLGWSGSATNITNQAGGTITASGTNALLCDAGTGATFTNRGLMNAVSGATLRLQRTFDNVNGVIEATDSSTVDLNVCSISGGELSSVGTGVVSVSPSATLDGSASAVTNNATIQIANSSVLTAVGSLVNNGVIRIDSTGTDTYFRPANAPLTLTGGGTVELSDRSTNWIYKNAAGGALINVDNTIIGAGNVGWNGSATNITNEAGGTITASGTNALVCDAGVGATFTNRGLMNAAAGGTLRLQRTFDNVGGTIEAPNGSAVSLSTCTISGGELSSVGSGVVTVSPSATLDGSASAVTNHATIQIANSSVLTAVGSLVNNGVIRIDSTGTDTYFRPANAPLMLTGGGTVELSDRSTNWIYKNAAGGELINVDNTIIGAGNIGWNGSATNITNEAGGTITASGTTALVCDAGVGATFTNRGLLNASGGATLRLQRAFDNGNGVIEVPSGATVALTTATITGGILKVAGTMTTSGANSLPGVTIQPGASAGQMTVTGVLPTLSSASTLECEIGGATPVTQHDVLAVSGAAAVNGTLRGVSINGFSPVVGNRFTVLTASNITGGFSGYSAQFPDTTLSIRFERTNATTGRMVVVRIGDMNCDGFITVGDISGFVLAITDATGYSAQNPGCELLNADTNGDGFVTVGDIGPFVQLLTGR